jgi:hypothetical protein
MYWHFYSLKMACLYRTCLRRVFNISLIKGVHSDSVHSDSVHSDGVHSDGVHSDGVHSDGVHSDGVRSDGVLLLYCISCCQPQHDTPCPIHVSWVTLLCGIISWCDAVLFDACVLMFRMDLLLLQGNRGCLPGKKDLVIKWKGDFSVSPPVHSVRRSM